MGGCIFSIARKDFLYKGVDKTGNQLRPIPYKSLDLNLSWKSFDIPPRTHYKRNSTICR